MVCFPSWSFTFRSPSLPQCYRDLALVSRDGMNVVLSKINQILMEKYLKLQDTCRTQVRSRSPRIAPFAPPGPGCAEGVGCGGLGARWLTRNGNVVKSGGGRREGRGLVVRVVGLKGLKGLFQPQRFGDAQAGPVSLPSWCGCCGSW